jgi:integrase
MPVKINLVFDRKKKAKKTLDKGVIEVRAYLNAKTKYFSTGIELYPTEWNESKELVARHVDADKLNDELNLLISRINNARREADFKNEAFDLDNVKEILKSRKVKTDSFIEFALFEINNDNRIKVVTKRSKRNTISKLLKYNQSKDVLFSDLTYSFCDGFINYLTGTKLGQNTVRKHNKNMKSLIQIAINKSCYDKSNPCDKIKIKELETNQEVPTIDHIKMLEDFQFEHYENAMELIRDMFLFSCYTGLRVSDYSKLEIDFIKHTPQGVILDFITKKVKKHAVIPLYKLFPISNENTTQPLKILDKYCNQKNKYVFPNHCDQYINRELKKLSVIVGIPIKLTSKMGRKFFATYMARKVPTPTLKRLLQHSDIKTTEKYIHLNDKMTNEDLSIVKWN